MQILSKTLATALLLGLPLMASAQPTNKDAGCPPGLHRAESEAVPGSGGVRQAESEAVPGSGGVRQAESEAAASRLASLPPCK